MQSQAEIFRVFHRAKMSSQSGHAIKHYKLYFFFLNQIKKPKTLYFDTELYACAFMRTCGYTLDLILVIIELKYLPLEK